MAKKYKVTRMEYHHFEDDASYKIEKVFYRWAVSEKQAIAWVKRENGDNKYNMVQELSYREAKVIQYKAEEVE